MYNFYLFLRCKNWTILMLLALGISLLGIGSVLVIKSQSDQNYAFAQKGIQGIIINPSQTLPFWTIKY